MSLPPRKGTQGRAGLRGQGLLGSWPVVIPGGGAQVLEDWETLGGRGSTGSTVGLGSLLPTGQSPRASALAGAPFSVHLSGLCCVTPTPSLLHPVMPPTHCLLKRSALGLHIPHQTRAWGVTQPVCAKSVPALNGGKTPPAMASRGEAGRGESGSEQADQSPH